VAGGGRREEVGGHAERQMEVAVWCVARDCPHCRLGRGVKGAFLLRHMLSPPITGSVCPPAMRYSRIGSGGMLAGGMAGARGAEGSAQAVMKEACCSVQAGRCVAGMGCHMR